MYNTCFIFDNPQEEIKLLLGSSQKLADLQPAVRYRRTISHKKQNKKDMARDCRRVNVDALCTHIKHESRVSVEMQYIWGGSSSSSWRRWHSSTVCKRTCNHHAISCENADCQGLRYIASLSTCRILRMCLSVKLNCHMIVDIAVSHLVTRKT